MRTVILITGVLIIGVLIGLAGARFGEQVTVASLAPDEATRVWVVELPRFIDRNFAVRVEDLETGNLTTIFTSPDEGRPVGSERIVWATDGSRFVLLGRHFYVHPEASLPSGESLYLLYDLRSGELWSNAAQQTELPTFSREDLAATQWRGALDARPPLSRRLRPAINFAGGHHEVLI
ncbi:MAG: hypothetical protein OEM99_10120 [Gammaproteobacteria bacterium]|nr:hypothetical protein [Gammaproteobacteria bacterium]